MSDRDSQLVDIIEKGFTQHKELNPQIFDENQKLHKDVRDTVIQIANDFIDSLGIDHIDFEDIVLVGSSVNYNWNPYSDVDIHVIYNFSDIDDDVDLVTEFFLAKKSVWNQDHDVKIHGYDVELYGQDIDEEVESGGIYSVVSNEWIREPKHETYTISEKSLIKKTKHFTRLIDDVINSDEENSKKINKLKQIKDKIKKYRKSGLEEGGEYSEENMVFKLLRRTGYIEKLNNYKHKLEDKEMSLDESLVNVNRLDTPERWFRSLVNKLDPLEFLNNLQVIYYLIDGKKYMFYSAEFEYLWVSRKLVWNVLKNKFRMSDPDIIKLIKQVINEKYNLSILDVAPGKWKS